MREIANKKLLGTFSEANHRLSIRIIAVMFSSIGIGELAYIVPHTDCHNLK